ncbi:MAG: reverse transcriptase-like protein [Alphaproteobacteria bacterium]|nr:reverse transcriptase-like protein [Alphaproteobacteria bacterium]
MRIYTDASQRGRISGIAFIVTDAKDREIYKKGMVINEPDNNTAELCAILFALADIRYLNVKHVTIFTDSWYAISAIRTGSSKLKDKPIIKQIKSHMADINSSLM